MTNKENIQFLINNKKHKPESKNCFGKTIQNLNNYPFFKCEKMEIEEGVFPNSYPLSLGSLNNPQNVTEFQAPILSFLHSKQENYRIDPSYMQKQKDISAKMRSILIDWLVEISIRFKLLPQTLFITVNVIDRYLSLELVSRQKLQLVGITALMIISKYEEIYPPLIKDYIVVCDNAYTKDDILDMEARIILALEFNLTQTSSLSFLNHLKFSIDIEPKAFVFARYILENSLYDLLALKYSNLELAVGAIYLVNKIFKKESRKINFQEITKISEDMAKTCAKDLYQIMQRVENSNLTALKKKFSGPEFYEVSKYRIEKVPNTNSN